MLGLANGAGSGIVMTLGADASPAVASLATGVWVMGLVGLLGAAAIHRRVGAVDPVRRVKRPG